MCCWRAAGVQTKLINAGEATESTLFEPIPYDYARHALSKCTSGVHHGWPAHEIVGMVIENIDDVVPGFGTWAMNKICLYGKDKMQK